MEHKSQEYVSVCIYLLDPMCPKNSVNFVSGWATYLYHVQQLYPLMKLMHISVIQKKMLIVEYWFNSSLSLFSNWNFLIFLIGISVFISLLKNHNILSKLNLSHISSIKSFFNHCPSFLWHLDLCVCVLYVRVCVYFCGRFVLSFGFLACCKW